MMIIGYFSINKYLEVYMAYKSLKERLKCNKPTKSPREGKSKVVKACADGKEKLVHFGDSSMPIKKDQPKNKKSYCARSAGIKGAKDKLSAGYWSRKAWDC